MLQNWKISLFLMSVVAAAHPFYAWAAMTSTNYSIYADSIGFGGSLSTSTSYTLQDTVGASPAGLVTSTSYEVRGGYQGAEQGDITLTLSSNDLNLGVLEPGAVNNASTVATISSDSTSGYTFSISAVSGTMPGDVSDGTVSAGSEEYGLSVSGTHSVVNGDVSITPRTLGSANTPVVSDRLTLTFKASRSTQSTPGDYSQTVTVAASANF